MRLGKRVPVRSAEGGSVSVHVKLAEESGPFMFVVYDFRRSHVWLSVGKGRGGLYERGPCVGFEHSLQAKGMATR